MWRRSFRRRCGETPFGAGVDAPRAVERRCRGRQTALAFAWLADATHALLRRVLGHSPWWPWLLAPLGFGVITWLTRRFFCGAEGSGIPQTIFALKPDTAEQSEPLLRPHVALGRALLAAAALLCGGSLGREGPTVHVWRHPGAAHLLRDRDGDDSAARHPAATHDQRGARHGDREDSEPHRSTRRWRCATPLRER
jgi:Voltage gated chloride channel